MFDSFLRYQDLIRKHFMRMQEEFRFQIIDGTRSEKDVYATLKAEVTSVLQGHNGMTDGT
jgi:thymidylate kinase